MVCIKPNIRIFRQKYLLKSIFLYINAMKLKKKCNFKPKTWTVKNYSSKINYFKIHLKQKSKKQRSWSRKYGQFSPQEIKRFFDKIKNQFYKSKDTRLKRFNKLIIWLCFVHSRSTLHEFCEKWNMCEQTLKNYITDVNIAILLTYKNDDGILGVPNDHSQHLMNKILINTNKKMVDAILYLDGTHKLCMGRDDANKRSWKFKWRAAWSHLFVVD